MPILPFPNLVMSLISKARVKIPNGLLLMQREYSISEHAMNRIKAHIPGLEIASQIARDEAEDEGGNTEDEIDRFTHGLEDTPQPSRPNRCPIFLDSRLGKIRLRV